jgi:CRP-like cAMP-binding protein
MRPGSSRASGNCAFLKSILRRWIMKLQPGQILVEQGAPGEELFLLFDGVLAVERDGESIAEVGPGAILGEMALLEGGRRTATLRTVTACRVAVVPGDRVDRRRLQHLAEGRQQESPGEGTSQ